MSHLEDEEEWRAVPDFDNLVSSWGRVKSVRNDKEQLLKLYIRPDGYPSVSLWKNNRGYNFKVHRLTTLCFIGPRPDHMEVCHIDSNRLNGHISNLKYGTRSDNIREAVRIGTHYSHGRTIDQCPKGHEYNKENTYLTKSGKRMCKTCIRNRSKPNGPRN